MTPEFVLRKNVPEIIYKTSRVNYFVFLHLCQDLISVEFQFIKEKTFTLLKFATVHNAQFASLHDGKWSWDSCSTKRNCSKYIIDWTIALIKHVLPRFFKGFKLYCMGRWKAEKIAMFTVIHYGVGTNNFQLKMSLQV